MLRVSSFIVSNTVRHLENKCWLECLEMFDTRTGSILNSPMTLHDLLFDFTKALLGLFIGWCPLIDWHEEIQDCICWIFRVALHHSLKISLQCRLYLIEGFDDILCELSDTSFVVISSHAVLYQSQCRLKYLRKVSYRVSANTTCGPDSQS